MKVATTPCPSIFGLDDLFEGANAQHLPAVDEPSSMLSSPVSMTAIQRARAMRNNPLFAPKQALQCRMCGGAGHQGGCDFDKFFKTHGGARVVIQGHKYPYRTRRGNNLFVVPEESVENAWVRRETALEVHGLDVDDPWLAHPSCNRECSLEAERLVPCAIIPDNQDGYGQARSEDHCIA